MLGSSVKNGKTLNKNFNKLLSTSLLSNQSRFKTQSFNYKGKNTLHDIVRGKGTSETGLPINESMSVSVWAKGYTRNVQINRPRESNRITSEVARDLLHQIKVLNTNPIIKLITFNGTGNGFLSAGYDFRELEHLMKNGDYETIYSLIRNTHKLGFYSADCETTTLSVINGVMMGPGVAIGTSSNYVVATPGSVFATPEASFGYFPDCGTTFLLSRINQKYEGLGTFLGLTGAQIKSSDLVHCGIATSFGFENVSQYLAERILQIQTDVTSEDIHNCVIESTESSVPALSFGFELYKIKEHFANKNSLEEIIQSLKNAENDSSKTKPERDWASRILANFESMSPLSLKITFRAIKECDQGLGLEETYQRDYRIASRLIKTKEFKEGMNAILYGVEPTWEATSDSAVESFFKPLTFEADQDCDLQLPEEAFLEDQIFHQIKKHKLVQVSKQ